MFCIITGSIQSKFSGRNSSNIDPFLVTVMMSSFIRIRGKKKLTPLLVIKKIQCICNMTPFYLRDYYSYFLLTKKKRNNYKRTLHSSNEDKNALRSSRIIKISLSVTFFTYYLYYITFKENSKKGCVVSILEYFNFIISSHSLAI